MGQERGYLGFFSSFFWNIGTVAMSKREGGESRNSVTLRLEPYYLKDPEVMVRNADF